MTIRTLAVLGIFVGLTLVGGLVAADKRADDKSALDLAKERREVVREINKIRRTAEDAGGRFIISDALEKEYLWSRRLMEAERDASGGKEERRAAIQAHFDRMKELEALEKMRFDAGRAPGQDWLAAKFYRLEAAYWLATAQ